MIADVGAQLRKGAVEYCVLGLLSREPMYGWQLSDALTSAGMMASIGTLYPLLARLRSNGWVQPFSKPSASGPARKYYRLTAAGEAQLVQFRSEWRSFAGVVTAFLSEDHDD